MANPWDVVSVNGGPAPPDNGDPWKVVEVGVPDGVPRMSASKRTLRQRFEDNADEGFKQSLAGASAGAMAAGLPGESGDYERGKNRDEAEAYKLRSEADPWYEAPGGLPGKAAAGLATLGGIVAGGLPSPESWIGPGKTWAGRIAGNAAVNAGADVPIQALQNVAGTHEGFDPWRVVAAGATGALVQGGFEGAGAAAKAVAPVAKAALRKGGEFVADVGRGLERSFDGTRPIPTREMDGWAVAAVDGEPVRAAPELTPEVAPKRTRTRTTPPPAFDEAQARATVSEILPGSTVTSGRRSPEHNAKVGGAATSYHLSGQALDIVPPKGASLAKFKADLAARGVDVAELLDEGDHWHVAWRGSNSPADVVPVAEAAPTPEWLQSVPETRLEDIPETPLGPASEAAPSRGQMTSNDKVDAPALDASARSATTLAPITADAAPTPPEGLDRAGPVRVTPADEWRVQATDETPTTGRFGGDGNPIPQAATTRAPPAPEALPSRDLTDDALDILRTGKSPRVDNGPSLVEHLARNGGLADNAGELRNIGADRWHTDKAFRSRLIRDGGRALDDAAVAAQEAGYLRERFGGDADTRATPQDLLDAIREELAGRPRYARNDEAGAELRQHAADVDEMLNVLGLDPKTMNNAQIKAQIDAYFRGVDAPAAPPRVGREMATERLGMAPRNNGRPTPQRVSPEAETRLRKRHAIDLSKYQNQISSPANASRNVGGLRDAPRPGDVPTAADGKAYTGQTVSQLAARLRSALGLTHRQGRMTLKGGAVGEFDPKSAVIRTKAVAELDVLAHEATHALEAKAGPALKAALSAHSTEVGALAYPGANPKHIQEEGFAEFGRWYLTNPAHAKKIAPNFYNAFEAAMQTDAPKVAAEMKAIQVAYQGYLSAPSLETAAASVALTGKAGPLEGMRRALAENGIGGAMRDMADQAYTAFVDDLHPVAMAVKALQQLHLKNTGQRLDLNVAKNPYALARLSREAYAAGHIDLMDGVVPYKGTDPEGPSLSQALELALGAKAAGKWQKKDLRAFDAYLIARRMVHEYDRYAAGDLKNPPDGASKEYHLGVIRDAEKKHDTFKPAAAIVYDWLTALWKKEHAAGLITGETYLKGLTAHPDYVPLMRDVSDKGGFRAGKPRGSMQYAGGSKEFKGSTRDVISPLSSMMRRAYELNAVIKRNDVMKALDDLGEAAGPGSGAIVERLPRHEVEAINVDAVDALSKAAEAAGLTERDITTLVHAAETALDGKSQATVFKRKEMNPAKGEAVVFVWRDGKKTPLLLPDGEFGQAMFTALTGMNRELQSAVVDAMAAGTQVLRYGVTLSPEFMARNFIRDQLATWINTDVGFTPVAGAIKGGKSAIANDALARRYAIAGGMRGGQNVAATRQPFPKTDAQAEAQLQHLRLPRPPLRLLARPGGTDRPVRNLNPPGCVRRGVQAGKEARARRLRSDVGGGVHVA